MDITTALILPEDLLILSANEVVEETRLQCNCKINEFIVTRPRSRTQSCVVNKELAELLKLFNFPKTIIDAVLELCAIYKSEPEKTLEQVFDVLTSFIKSGWLVPAEAKHAKRISPSYNPGDTIDDFEIISCKHLFEDTEIYQVRLPNDSIMALKIARSVMPNELKDIFENEARILKSIRMPLAPKLERSGALQGRPYLLMTWCNGGTVTQVATRLRQIHGTNGQHQVLKLCCNLLKAYAQLHGEGIIHGDVSAKNVLVDSMGNISIIDFGFSRFDRDPGTSTIFRGGVPEYYEPELASEFLKSGCKINCSFAGEQYSLAALIYLLVTGQTYLNFSTDKSEMLKQIAFVSPLPFVQVGSIAWPALEEVLGTALMKDPGQRFSSVALFTLALEKVATTDRSTYISITQDANRNLSEELLTQLAEATRHNFSLPVELPKCSITFGAAGIAYTLYSVATIRSDPKLLAAADFWIERAIQMKQDSYAFSHKATLNENVIRNHSVYFGLSGVYLVQALIAQSMGDDVAVNDAITNYISICKGSCENMDLISGLAGILTGCGLLVDVIGVSIVQTDLNHPIQKVYELARSVLKDMVIRLELETWGQIKYFGIAHGWAGICYSALLWSEVSRDKVPDRICNKIEELFSLGQRTRQGVRWPIRVTSNEVGYKESFMDSWCHGSPGYVHFWTAAYRVLGISGYLDMAEKSAQMTYEAPATFGGLCCGYAGRAYALLNMFRHTGNNDWLKKADTLTKFSFGSTRYDHQQKYSLFHGLLGSVLLAEDLKMPERASFPLFERECRG